MPFGEREQVIYDLREMDWKKRRPNRFVSVVGKRDSGKTTWLMYLAMKSEWRTKGLYMVIAETEAARDAWSKLVPEAVIFPPSKRLLKKIQNERQSLVKKYRRRNEPFPVNLHLSVYIDDCGAEKKDFLRSDEMEKWVCYSRQWEMDVTVSFQYFKNFAPSGRTNSDEIIFLATQDEAMIKDMHKTYCSSLCKYVDFSKIALITQENYGACWIKNHGAHTQVTDLIFHHWIPLELFDSIVDEDGDEKLVFREFLPCGDITWRNWMEEHKKEDIEMRRNSEDEAEDGNEVLELSQISHTHEDKYGRTIQVRCTRPKVKND